MTRHFVHIYATVRVKIAVDGCEDHAAAIDAADNLLGERKHQLFDRTFREESDLGEPTRPDVQLLYSEADDEASGFLVDEAGDEEYHKTREYGPDGRTPANQPIRVLVALEGGIVQGAVCDHPRCSVTVLDYDTEGADASTVYAIPQRGQGTSDAFVAGHSADHDPAFIDAAEAAPLADPQAAIVELRERAADWTTDWPEMAADNLARAAEIEAQLASEKETEAA